MISADEFASLMSFQKDLDFWISTRSEPGPINFYGFPFSAEESKLLFYPLAAQELSHLKDAAEGPELNQFLQELASKHLVTIVDIFRWQISQFPIGSFLSIPPCGYLLWKFSHAATPLFRRFVREHPSGRQLTLDILSKLHQLVSKHQELNGPWGGQAHSEISLVNLRRLVTLLGILIPSCPDVASSMMLDPSTPSLIHTLLLKVRVVPSSSSPFDRVETLKNLLPLLALSLEGGTSEPLRAYLETNPRNRAVIGLECELYSTGSCETSFEGLMMCKRCKAIDPILLESPSEASLADSQEDVLFTELVPRLIPRVETDPSTRGRSLVGRTERSLRLPVSLVAE